MTQTAKNIVITAGFVSAFIISVVSDFLPITFLAFLAYITLAIVWVKNTTWGQKVYEKYLVAVGGDKDIEDFKE